MQFWMVRFVPVSVVFNLQAPWVLRVLLRIGLLDKMPSQCDAIRGNTDRSRQDRAGFARAAAKQRDLLADCEILGIGPGFDLNRVAGDGRVNGSLDRGELPVAYLRHKGLGGIFPHHKAAVLILDRHIAVLAQGLRHFSGEGAARRRKLPRRQWAMLLPSYPHY